MVGTGAAALADALALTRHAAELGFAGALVLPPFYYKGVPDDGLVRLSSTALVEATARSADPDLSLSFPGQFRHSLVDRADPAPARRIRRPHRRAEGFVRRHGAMRARPRRVAPDFAVFPSTEAVLLDARGGAFAGCISATANLNADLCARAWRDGDRRRSSRP